MLTRNGWLAGCTYHYRWVPGENFAQCVKSSNVTNPDTGLDDIVPRGAPDHTIRNCPSGNGHGLYGYYDGSNTYRGHGRPEGVIEGYGTVMQGSRGFRATHAEIVALTFPMTLLVSTTMREAYERMLQRYAGIPIFDTFEEMVDLFPPNTGEVWENNR
jgi:hypothetical protein